jgi:two-component system response regulator NreC
MAISILLADDHEIFRHGLQMLLNSQTDFQVVGQAADGLEAVALAERLRPDVLIVDLIMPGLNGIEVTSQIKQRLQGIRVVVLSMYDDERYVVSALQNGADGFVLKDANTSDLLQAVRIAMAGQCFLSPSLTKRAVQGYIKHCQTSEMDGYDKLTSREREVMRLSIESLTSAQIAGRLGISARTVETHRANLMHKLELHSHAELVAYVNKHKIIP